MMLQELKRASRLATWLLVALLSWTGQAAAETMSPDPTGLWFRANEPGTGAAIFRQNDVMFVVLFVYDQERRPTWYVSSSVRSTGLHLDPIGSTVFEGTLYRTAGSGFASPFNSAEAAVDPVGTVSLAYVPGANGAQDLALAYELDGVRRGRTLQRQTWSSNMPLLAGTYSGTFDVVSNSTACASIQVPAFVFPAQAALTVGATSASGISINWRRAGDPTSCTIDGTYIQEGQFGRVTGSLSCGVGSQVGAPIGTVEITSIAGVDNGFSARAAITMPLGSDDPSQFCRYAGSMGGVRRR